MNVKKIAESINVKPSERKIKKVRHFAESKGVLPKEEPIERKTYLATHFEMFERVKDRIQVALDKYRGQK